MTCVMMSGSVLKLRVFVVSVHYNNNNNWMNKMNSIFITFIFCQPAGTCTEMSCDGTPAFRCKDGSCLKTTNHSFSRNIGSKYYKVD